MKKLFLPLLVVAVSLAFSATGKKVAGPDQYAATITADDLRKYLSVLASDAYEGRETGERGQKMAAEYISSFFKDIGIPPQQDGTWYQQVKLKKISRGGSSITAYGTAGQTLQLEVMKDYYYSSNTAGGEFNVNSIVFAGYGIDDPKYSDYSGHDSSWYKGKLLVILDGEPKKDGRFIITGTDKPGTWTTQRKAKYNAAKNRGALGLLVIPVDYEKSKELAKHNTEGVSLVPDEPVINQEQQLDVIYISSSVADTLFKMGGMDYTTQQIRNEISSTGQPLSFEARTEVSVMISPKEEHITSENVLGYVEGTDLKNEVVVVTAHYDHLGIRDGMVFNGADDDGSGTVAVMELAEAFMQAKKDGHGPRRSMLFMTVTGEEKGLLGSSWYTRHPVYPLATTMCDLNIDMIGRVDTAHRNDTNYVYVIGSDRISPDLKKSIEAANKRHSHLTLDYKYDDENDPNNFYYRSDHYNFAKNDIPVAFFFNGVHSDYHKETDEVSKISFNLMEKRARLIFYTAWDMANRKKPLAKKLVKK